MPHLQTNVRTPDFFETFYSCSFKRVTCLFLDAKCPSKRTKGINKRTNTIMSRTVNDTQKASSCAPKILAQKAARVSPKTEAKNLRKKTAVTPRVIQHRILQRQTERTLELEYIQLLFETLQLNVFQNRTCLELSKKNEAQTKSWIV